MRKAPAALGSLWLAAAASAAHGQSATYTYDSLGRLVETGYANGADVFYAYDAAGNRTQQTIELSTNQQPIAVNDTLATWINQAKSLDPRTNDSDPDGDSFAVTSVSSPANGSAAFSGASVVTYTPGSAYVGPDSFTYTITDARGAARTASVSVTVTDTNNPPNAVNDALAAQMNTAITFDPRVNDADPNGDLLTVASVTAPAHGTAAVMAGSAIQYTPATGYMGADSFSYTLSDGKGGSDSATVNVTVSGTNSPPVASNDSMLIVALYTGTAFRPSKTIDPRGNDNDPDGHPLTVTGVTNGAKGIASFTATTVKYTYGSSVRGPLQTTDSFTYTVSDGNGGTDTATVIVTIRVTDNR
ncbi:MAG TPA: Ig-like domain-containing protein [Caulobacteraceae bacterium]|nr:Ig-like domain-containing protein [Caulobacteraceae bacterium]